MAYGGDGDATTWASGEPRYVCHARMAAVIDVQTATIRSIEAKGKPRICFHFGLNVGARSVSTPTLCGDSRDSARPNCCWCAFAADRSAQYARTTALPMSL